MTKEQSLNQLGELFLTDEKGGDLVICSDLKRTADSFNEFSVMNVSTGEKRNITFKISEV